MFGNEVQANNIYGFIWPGFAIGTWKLTGILLIGDPESKICDVANNPVDMAEIQMKFLPEAVCSSSSCSTNSFSGSQFQAFSKKDALNSDQELHQANDAIDISS